MTTAPSTEPVLRSRLLPKISFRVIFAVTALAAVVASLARAAGEGGPLARALLVALAFPAFCFTLFAVLFLIGWAVALLAFRGHDDTLQGSPFAEDQLPPQLLPPRESQP